MSFDLLDWTILGPAVCAGLLVLSTHVPLGQEVLKRGIIFIDLAIAQIAGLGVLAAGVMGWEDHAWAVQLSAIAASVLLRAVPGESLNSTWNSPCDSCGISSTPSRGMSIIVRMKITTDVRITVALWLSAHTSIP